jgi:hypothetical protein
MLPPVVFVITKVIVIPVEVEVTSTLSAPVLGFLPPQAGASITIKARAINKTFFIFYFLLFSFERG